MLDFYGGIYYADAIDRAVYVTCNHTDKGAACLRFNGEIFQNKIFYFVCLRIVGVRTASQFADNTEKADNFYAAKVVCGGTFGCFVYRIVIVFDRKVFYNVSAAIKIADKRRIGRADGRENVFEMLAVSS